MANLGPNERMDEFWPYNMSIKAYIQHTNREAPSITSLFSEKIKFDPEKVNKIDVQDILGPL